MSILVFMFVILMTMVTDTIMLATLMILVIWSHDNFQDIEETRHIEYVSDSE
jgi:uncharacterized membrane protein YqjE